MKENNTAGKALRAKQPWRSPEIISVGGVLDLTEGTTENVRDNGHHEPPTWMGHKPTDSEISLD